MAAKKYVSPPLRIEKLDHKFNRADIQFHGLDHAEASFEGRVFLNNPDADENTAKTDAQGYAGSFHVFGHGGCFGDAGHCDVQGQRRAYDPRPSHPLIPIKKTLIATDAVRRAVEQKPEVTVTVVPIVNGGTRKCDLENVLKFKRLSIVTYL
jgi:tyrosinase